MTRHRIPLRRAKALISVGIAGFALLSAGAATAQTTRPADAAKAAEKTARDIRAVTGAKPAAKKLPDGDPCTIVSSADVQKVFPGVKAERSKRLEEYGITECGWKGANGDVVLVVQESFNDGKSAREDALGMAQGFVNPLDPRALKNVRVEAFPALGVDAAAFVETVDKGRGIVGDGALMELRKDRHNISLGSADLARRDRAAALKAFEDLGRVAAKRL
ncbi:MAG TPA: hypothetical protein VGO85_12635 [Caldimonas sp.]|jgi:hypothetical protein|nr:hypothetical protein [Caldimonas sp.]